MRPSIRPYCHVAVLVLASFTIVNRYGSARATELNLFFRDQQPATVGTTPNPTQRYPTVISRRSNGWKPITTNAAASSTTTSDIDPITSRAPLPSNNRRVVVNFETANRDRPISPPVRQTQPRPRDLNALRRRSNDGGKRTKKATLNEEDLVRTFYTDGAYHYEQSSGQPAVDRIPFKRIDEGHRHHLFDDNNNDKWEGGEDDDGSNSRREDRQNSYQVHEEVDEGGNRVDDFKYANSRPTAVSSSAQTFTANVAYGLGSNVRRNSTVGILTTGNRYRQPPSIAATSSKRKIPSDGRDRREFERSTNETREDNKFTKPEEESVSGDDDDDYYAQFFDSFGKDDENGEDGYQAANTEATRETDDEPIALPSSSLTLFARRPDDTQSSVYESRKRSSVAAVTTTTTTTPTSSSSAKPEVDSWPLMGDWMNLTSFELRNLIPQTLKANIVSVRRLLVECWSFADTKDGSNTERKMPSTSCFKKITFDILDKAIEADVVKLTDTVSLVRENKSSETGDESGTPRSFTYDNAINETTEWLPHLVEKIQQLFSTHSLKVKLTSAAQQSENSQVEGRRRHYRRVFPIMVGAYMILSTVLIPLGFKFMTLLGTKSLLLSKLSLMIALMGGLKKYIGSGTSHSYPPPSPYAHYGSLYSNPYSSYLDPWRRDEYRKISTMGDEPTEFSHFTEEVE